MLKGGSLFYATVIALIIAILSSSLMLFSYFKEQEKNIYIARETLSRNAISGIHLAIASDSVISSGSEKIVDLFNKNTDSVLIKKINWGSYHVLLSKAFSGSKNRRKAALIGTFPDSAGKAALYLQDNGKSLTVCGKTNIRGVCYLPQSGIKRGNIEGKSFQGSELVNGWIKQSKHSLPVIDKNMLYQIYTRVTLKNEPDDSIVYYKETNQADSISNSFFNKTIRLYSHGKIVLTNGGYYAGNMVICSDTEVIVPGSCLVNDIMIFAPIVRVESAFNGNMQVYAKDSICIGMGVKLNYPSVLGIIRNKATKNFSVISIGEGTNITGNVFGYNEIESTEEQILINVGVGDTITGQIFTNGEVNLNGTVYGNVTCSHFICKSSAGEYEDYLVDAVIDMENRSKYYINTTLFKGPGKSIVKWVY